MRNIYSLFILRKGLYVQRNLSCKQYLFYSMFNYGLKKPQYSKTKVIQTLLNNSTISTFYSNQSFQFINMRRDWMLQIVFQIFPHFLFTFLNINIYASYKEISNFLEVSQKFVSLEKSKQSTFDILQKNFQEVIHQLIFLKNKTSNSDYVVQI